MLLWPPTEWEHRCYSLLVSNQIKCLGQESWKERLCIKCTLMNFWNMCEIDGIYDDSLPLKDDGPRMLDPWSWAASNRASRHLTAPSSDRSHSQSGMIWILLVHDSSPGAAEQNLKPFHFSWEQHTHTLRIKQKMNHILRALRGGFMPENIFPASSILRPSQGFYVCRVCPTWCKGKAGRRRHRAVITDYWQSPSYLKGPKLCKIHQCFLTLCFSSLVTKFLEMRIVFCLLPPSENVR